FSGQKRSGNEMRMPWYYGDDVCKIQRAQELPTFTTGGVGEQVDRGRPGRGPSIGVPVVVEYLGRVRAVRQDIGRRSARNCQGKETLGVDLGIIVGEHSTLRSRNKCKKHRNKGHLAVAALPILSAREYHMPLVVPLTIFRFLLLPQIPLLWKRLASTPFYQGSTET
ncbi:MAG TPA: hypothetical protein VKK81_20850, partial [Candidatus Binatia bacterium]|nr:hypothetical protein [Candidatus Binatia bacterium]